MVVGWVEPIVSHCIGAKIRAIRFICFNPRFGQLLTNGESLQHFYGASKVPILDHLHPEISDIAPFESFHSAWTTYIVERLNEILPEGFLAIPQTSIGAREVDVRADKIRGMGQSLKGSYQPQLPITTQAEFPSVFEVFVDYIEWGRHITVGAIEILSRANKDSFVAKCENLIVRNVSLIIVDVLELPFFNLHNQLLRAVKATAGSIEEDSENPLYCAAYRKQPHGESNLGMVDIWHSPLKIGDTLPELPLYITSEVAVPVNFEESYMKVCKVFRIVSSQ